MMSGTQPTKNAAIKHFQVNHKDGYLIDWLTVEQLEALDNILKCRRGDVNAEYMIEQILYFLDIH